MINLVGKLLDEVVLEKGIQPHELQCNHNYIGTVTSRNSLCMIPSNLTEFKVTNWQFLHQSWSPTHLLLLIKKLYHIFYTQNLGENWLIKLRKNYQIWHNVNTDGITVHLCWTKYPENVVDNIADNIEENVADNIEENGTDDFEENGADNIEENGADNAEDNVEENVEENIGENIEENGENVADSAVVDNVEDNVAYNVEENVVDNVEESVLDSVVMENVEDNVEENIVANIEKNDLEEIGEERNPEEVIPYNSEKPTKVESQFEDQNPKDPVTQKSEEKPQYSVPEISALKNPAHPWKKKKN